MFWTKWVRGFNKVILWVGIAASVILGLVFAADEPASLLFIPIGVLITITSVSLIMMITEISVTLDEINTTLKQQNKNSSSGSLYASEPEYHSGSSSWVCSCGATNSNSSLFCNTCGKLKGVSSSESSKPVSTWVCNCGARNSESSKFCRKCGKQKSNGTVTCTVTTWICPKCGKKNPNSSRVCEDCAYEK